MARYLVYIFIASVLFLCFTGGIRDNGKYNKFLTTNRYLYMAEYLEGEEPFRRYEFRIAVKFKNRTDDTLYLDRCLIDSPYPKFGIGLVNSHKGSAYSRFWACIEHGEDFRVLPGAVRRDTLSITGPNEWDQHGNVVGVMEGRHRLSYFARSCKEKSQGVDCSVPDSLVQSNIFELQVYQ